MAPLPHARHLHVQSPLASSSGATTAGSAAASFAGSTRPSRFASMSLHASTLRASCTARATVAMVLSASGSICARVVPTARAQVVAPQPQRSQSRLLHQPSAPRIHVWAALPRALVHGTGALSEPEASFSSRHSQGHALSGSWLFNFH